MVRSWDRGHLTILIDGEWLYEDTRKPVDHKRPCVRCKRPPTKEGYDACLGHVEGVSSVCCGHGVGKPYSVKEK